MTNFVLANDKKRHVLDYEAIVAEYKHRLVNVLRKFHATEESLPFLDTWVHDEDDAKSVRGLLEGARDAGVRELGLRFGATTLARVDRPTLKGVLEAFGEVRWNDDGNAVDASVTFQAVAPKATAKKGGSDEELAAARARVAAQRSARSAPAVSDGSSYDHALAGHVVTHEGTTHDGDWNLSFAIEGDTVIDAKHNGAVGVDRALLDRFCALAIGLPVREVADHAVIRLEHALRGRTGKRPVAGIVHPTNADPRLARLQALVRDSLAGVADRSAEFEARPNDAWLALDHRGRVARVQAAIDAVSSSFGLEPAAAQCMRVDKETRVVLGFAASIPAARRSAVLLDLENAIKERVDTALSLYLEELEDKNKLRRLPKVEETRA